MASVMLIQRALIESWGERARMLGPSLLVTGTKITATLRFHTRVARCHDGPVREFQLEQETAGVWRPDIWDLLPVREADQLRQAQAHDLFDLMATGTHSDECMASLRIAATYAAEPSKTLSTWFTAHDLEHAKTVGAMLLPHLGVALD